MPGPAAACLYWITRKDEHSQVCRNHAGAVMHPEGADGTCVVAFAQRTDRRRTRFKAPKAATITFTKSPGTARNGGR